MKRTTLTLRALLFPFCFSPTAWAVPIGHHGGMILNCEAPHFFDENPAADAKVSSFQKFSLTASDNTDPATIKAYVNNQPVAVIVEKDRAGRYAVSGGLPQAVSKGRIWLKVTADSQEGCDNFKSWFIHTAN